jgi:hypothetical protein
MNGRLSALSRAKRLDRAGVVVVVSGEATTSGNDKSSSLVSSRSAHTQKPERARLTPPSSPSLFFCSASTKTARVPEQEEESNRVSRARDDGARARGGDSPLPTARAAAAAADGRAAAGRAAPPSPVRRAARRPAASRGGARVQRWRSGSGGSSSSSNDNSSRRRSSIHQSPRRRRHARARGIRERGRARGPRVHRAAVLPRRQCRRRRWRGGWRRGGSSSRAGRRARRGQVCLQGVLGGRVPEAGGWAEDQPQGEGWCRDKVARGSSSRSLYVSFSGPPPRRSSFTPPPLLAQPPLPSKKQQTPPPREPLSCTTSASGRCRCSRCPCLELPWGRTAAQRQQQQRRQQHHPPPPPPPPKPTTPRSSAGASAPRRPRAPRSRTCGSHAAWSAGRSRSWASTARSRRTRGLCRRVSCCSVKREGGVRSGARSLLFSPSRRRLTPAPHPIPQNRHIYRQDHRMRRAEKGGVEDSARARTRAHAAPRRRRALAARGLHFKVRSRFSPQPLYVTLVTDTLRYRDSPRSR